MSAGKYRQEHNCLNCGQHVEKHYCSNCGQPNLELKENFWQFISHSIAHYFHFDNKFFQTLKPLLIEPGQVTLDYLAGKRARYINPVSMYIFVSIVYFIVVPIKLTHNKEEKHKNTGQSKARLEITKLTDVLQEEDLNIDPNSVLGKTTALMSKKITIKEFKALGYNDQLKEIKTLEHRKDSLKTDEFDDLLDAFRGYNIIKQDSTYESYLARQQKLKDNEKDDWFERILKKREIAVNQKSSSGDWSVKEELEHYRPKQYFLLMPLLALMIMWNFRKNHIFYLDHLIFTIHGTTAFFILQIFTTPLIRMFGKGSLMGNLIQMAVVVGIAWYMFKALTVFYQRPRKVTIRKMITLIILYFIAFAFSEWIIERSIYYFLA
ncbi:DUF3667 domain-containing protein [Pedobacter nutrimenti]|uniref:Uncharacterized protein DUF3667 n=1 Tax=Pedobacter nutrimenti TaxID=1241337 RepID=A0A318UZ75_9SPHI|nr:DUF3667 domain-containing protein [Pedobacter nutrimenti]PYF76899.1 uncharacterized protein DUF3667 [Pedobacter nutrimenti]